MNTWWIAKSNGVFIITVYSGFRSAIGPYWSVAEALKMLEKWRKQAG